MATPNDEATYSLDPETVGVLERVARRWGVSKSEALRQAIHASDAAPATPAEPAEPAVVPEPGDAPNPRLVAFRRLQAIMNLDRARADAWVAEIRAERDANL